ncbi:MAG: superoxide dismutase family protein [Candidatus Eiseniibacteriota bacterium]
MRASLVPVLLVAGGAIGIAGCGSPELPHPAETPAPNLMTHAVADIRPTEGNECHGTVEFSSEDGKIKIVASIEGLAPGSTHAIHIHEVGDCKSPDAMSAGGHYNPEHHDHGLPTQTDRHAGDLGNFTADNGGKARYEIVVDNISLVGSKNPIMGRAVIIHEKPDDGSQPVGNAGARLGCGLIHLPSPK